MKVECFKTFNQKFLVATEFLEIIQMISKCLLLQSTCIFRESHLFSSSFFFFSAVGDLDVFSGHPTGSFRWPPTWVFFNLHVDVIFVDKIYIFIGRKLGRGVCCWRRSSVMYGWSVLEINQLCVGITTVKLQVYCMQCCVIEINA